jgi:hypothetical protein
VNLDFTQDEFLPGRENLPYISEARRWVISWECGGADYEFSRPADVLFQGQPTACVKPVSKPGIGYLYQHFAAARYRNKRVRYTVYIATKRARKGARLFVDMYDADSIDLLYHPQEPVIGTKKWTKREFEFDVPVEAYAISIGGIIEGPGEMYLGGLKFEVVGSA